MQYNVLPTTTARLALTDRGVLLSSSPGTVSYTPICTHVMGVGKSAAWMLPLSRCFVNQ